MEEGRVIGLDGKDAVLEIDKSPDCNGCKACCAFSSEDSGLMIAKVPNTLGAKEGDLIKIDISERQEIMANAIVFLLPVGFLLIGYLLGAYILSSLFKTGQQGTGVFFAAVGFLVSLFVIKIAEDKQRSYFKPRMIKKIGN
jgi:positive regulator of sigma E activity